ncbi:hypothetical protein RZS08_15810, partial [Arthrospira platensis SPKY1]|nr:hypothetical protein [Arthrospira platensis SPKY1]
MMRVPGLAAGGLITALRAADRAGGELPGTVDQQQVVAVPADVRLQTLVALQLSMPGTKRPAQRLGFDRIEPLAQLRVARGVLDPVPPLPIAPDARFVVIGPVELQQGWIFQTEHRQTRHQRIDQRNRAPGARIADLGERTADRAQQARRRQILAQLRQRGGGVGGGKAANGR